MIGCGRYSAVIGCGRYRAVIGCLTRHDKTGNYKLTDLQSRQVFNEGFRGCTKGLIILVLRQLVQVNIIPLSN